LTQAHSAEVESEYGDTVLLKRFGGTIDHLHMHRPAIKRMGMTDYGCGNRKCLGNHEERLEATRRTKKLQRFRQTHVINYIFHHGGSDV
jgi:hypothetical protein